MKKKNNDPIIFEGQLTIQRMPGKGGWHFVTIPVEKIVSDRHFGMVRVKGSIDEIAFADKSLMPMGNGNLFLPLDAKLRKQLRKGEGKTINVILHRDDAPLAIPHELQACLDALPEAEQKFNALSDAQKRYLVKSIFSSKNDVVIARRIDKWLSNELN